MPIASMLLVLTVASLLSVTPVAAQPGTPALGAEPCAVPHRDLTAIVAVLNPPGAQSGRSPVATPDHQHETEAPETEAPDHATPVPIEPVGTPRLLRPELPAGSPASAEVVARLTETMRQYVACANAGDVTGLMSLVSDDFLRRSFASSIVTEADLQAYADAGQTVPADQRRRLVAIREARQLADGRVAALVDIAPVANPNRSAIDTDLVTFTLVDGRWLIDRYLAGVTFWYGPDATPAP